MNQSCDASTSDGPTNDSTIDLKLPPDLASHPTDAETSTDCKKSVLQTVSAPVIPDIVSSSAPHHSHDLKIPALAEISGVYSDETVAVNQPTVKVETHNGK